MMKFGQLKKMKNKFQKIMRYSNKITTKHSKGKIMSRSLTKIKQDCKMNHKDVKMKQTSR